MTQTIEPGQGTRNLTYRIGPPAFRRPDATGELPMLFHPGGPAGAAELARLAIGETLILPTGAQPAPARPAVATVYGERPEGYQSRHRRPAPSWPAATAIVALAAVAFAGGFFSCLLTGLVA
jgi:hypothetical protein